VPNWNSGGGDWREPIDPPTAATDTTDLKANVLRGSSGSNALLLLRGKFEGKK